MNPLAAIISLAVQHGAGGGSPQSFMSGLGQAFSNLGGDVNGLLGNNPQIPLIQANPNIAPVGKMPMAPYMQQLPIVQAPNPNILQQSPYQGMQNTPIFNDQGTQVGGPQPGIPGANIPSLRVQAPQQPSFAPGPTFGRYPTTLTPQIYPWMQNQSTGVTTI